MRVLQYFLTFVFPSAALRRSADESPNAAIDEDSESLSSDGDDTFLYDVLARTNEGVVNNIDAVDLALLAVLAVIAAVVGFGIDKVREIASPWNWAAFGLLGASALLCVLGYLIGVFKTREAIDPRRFLIDFADDPEGTRATAATGTARAYRQNAWDRRAKRVAIALALGFLVLGSLLIAMARSSGA